MNLILDIETGPLPDEQLRAVEPEFTAPGNYKDPAKIAAVIEEKRATWREQAALSALTGRVIAVGCRHGGKSKVIHGEEKAVIREALEHIVGLTMGARGKLIGFGLHSFDLPFLCRRALLLGLKLPVGFLPSGHSRFFWPSWTIDLREVWGFGELSPAGSLDQLGASFGFGRKNGKGADFARLYADDATRPKALAYLENDLVLTDALATRLLPDHV